MRKSVKWSQASCTIQLTKILDFVFVEIVDGRRKYCAFQVTKGSDHKVTHTAHLSTIQRCKRGKTQKLLYNNYRYDHKNALVYKENFELSFLNHYRMQIGQQMTFSFRIWIRVYWRSDFTAYINKFRSSYSTTNPCINLQEIIICFQVKSWRLSMFAFPIHDDPKTIAQFNNHESLEHQLVDIIVTIKNT